MNHPVFQDRLFDEADYIGEVRKRPAPAAPLTPMKVPPLKACPPHHIVRNSATLVDKCVVCGKSFDDRAQYPGRSCSLSRG